jgi:large subunit ribosomal protein L4e
VSRPTVSVYDAEDAKKVLKQVALPGIYTAPIRPDVINFVHTQMNKNRRQAYAVDAERAGMQTAAASWGTGRAVSRIPRVPGGGTHRAGQGAFGNMCRGGRMFNPTRIWRRWHRKISVGHRRYAVSSAVAASAVTALVMARGHRVSEIPELPLVLGGTALNEIAQTKKAYELLEKFGVSEDVDKAKESKRVRRGAGKQRNRRYVSRLGPLLVHANSAAPLVKAVRNLPGVDVCYVDDLNLLQLAPGGHMGRLVVWTEDAFSKLDRLFGEAAGAKAELKSGFSLARPSMSNADVSRIINSEEVQKLARPKKDRQTVVLRKKNPLKNLGVMIKLNPYAPARIRAELRLKEARAKAKADKIKPKKQEGATSSKQKREFMAKILQ